MFLELLLCSFTYILFSIPQISHASHSILSLYVLTPCMESPYFLLKNELIYHFSKLAKMLGHALFCVTIVLLLYYWIRQTVFIKILFCISIFY